MFPQEPGSEEVELLCSAAEQVTRQHTGGAANAAAIDSTCVCVCVNIDQPESIFFH